MHLFNFFCSFFNIHLQGVAWVVRVTAVIRLAWVVCVASAVGAIASCCALARAVYGAAAVLVACGGSYSVARFTGSHAACAWVFPMNGWLFYGVSLDNDIQILADLDDILACGED